MSFLKRCATVSIALAVASAAMLSNASDSTPEVALTSKATGTIVLSVSRDVPLYAEFDRSADLTSRLSKAMTAAGIEITTDRANAKAALLVRGDIALLGGPVYYKGVKVPIGDAVERSLAAARAEVTRADVVQTAAGIALNKAALESAITPFWRGMALSGLASVLGEATGLKAGFNKALTGDPRGICLSRCDDWNKVNQTAYVSLVLQSGDQKQEVRVLTRAISEAILAEQLLDRALSDALGAVSVEPAAAAVGK